jgi:tetratricopeptide (TPR) repeat protein
MMVSKQKRFVSGLSFLIVWLIIWAAVLSLLSSCAKHKKPEAVSYVAEQDIPSVIAVLPARFLKEKTEKGDLQLDPESENGKFVAELVRGVVHNQMTGKGYETRVLSAIDKKLASLKQPWHEMKPEEICKLLSADGLIYTDIVSASMVTAVAFNLYSIEARIRMVSMRGKELGSWTETSTRRKIALPTGVVGAAATVAEAIMDKVDEAERKNMRSVAYDWGWKIAQLVPDNPKAQALPEVVSVATNVDKRIFGIGEQITVEVNAEKGLTCTFDIGDLKKDIPLPSVEDTIYRGSYVVKEGDRGSNQTITIHMTRPNGVSRLWIETGGTIDIHGVPPAPPEKVKAEAGRQGITISWGLPKAEGIKGFEVERGERAVGEFAVISSTNEQSLLDTEVPQGKTYYYRVRSIDEAGNRSAPKKAIKATMPHFDEVTLGEVLKDTIIPGVYKLSGKAEIPAGETVTVEPGARITMAKDSSITVKGSLKGAGEAKERILFTGEGWKGINVETGGSLELTNAGLAGCNQCIEARLSAVTLRSVNLSGSQGAGIMTGEGAILDMEDSQIKGFESGVAIDGGKARIAKSSITGNKIGIVLKAGDLALSDSNVFGNTEKEISSSKAIVLEGNYLGAATTKDIKLDGKITVKSLLDAPAPQGRRIVLIEDKEVSPEEIKERFVKFKDDGIKSFQGRKYGEAYESLSKAAALKDDKEVYLYLAYTQMNLGEDAALEATLERGIKAYPYEVKLYQLYVRHLASAGKKKEALALLEKALKLNPEDQGLKSLKESLQDRPAPPPPTEAAKQDEAKKAPAQSDVKGQDKKKEEAPSQAEKEGAFADAKKQGIDLFAKRNFKEAEEKLLLALSVREDKESYLYLAYTQMNLGEEERLVSTLKKALAAFPREVRLYQMYVRYLMNKGDKAEAAKILEEGLKIAPEDATLRMQKDFLERGN